MIKSFVKLILKAFFYSIFTLVIVAVAWHFNYINVNFDTFLLSDEATVVEEFVLGDYEKRPFYQTEADYEFIKAFNENRDKYHLDALMEYYNKYYRRYFRSGRLDVDAVRVTSKQYPIIYKYVSFACSALKEKIPRIYLTKDDGPNIRTVYWKDPVLIISANLTWAFKPEELQYLISREIGHIKARHIYYRDLLQVFKQVNEYSIPGKLVKWVDTGISLDFIDWFKHSEITADRAGLTVIGDINVAINALIKLKLGANVDSYYGQINPEEYIKQLSTIKEKSRQGLFGPLLSELRSNTPFLPVRMKNLLSFYSKNSNAFK
jgi:Zn-dependent protease with chaperone function